MATEPRGTRGGRERVRHHQLRQLLTLQSHIFRGRREALRQGLPAEVSGVTDNEEHSADDEELAVEASVLELTAQTVKGIETALRRLNSGEYGLCSDCGAKVSGIRLKALPFATLCHSCQDKRDSATARPARSVTSNRRFGFV
jgi:DnaK suppressor protein